MKHFITLFLFFTVYTFAQKLIINCDKVGSELYIDGIKKAKITAKNTEIDITKGKHEIKIIHKMDENWRGIEIQNPNISEATKKLIFKTFLVEELKKAKVSTKERFSRDIDIVHDNKFNRDWQDDAQMSKRKKVWKDAVKYCNNLNLAGHNDWKLPDDDTLVNILEYSKQGSSLSKAFKYVNEGFYWSSTQDDENKQNAYKVYLEEGCSDSMPKTELFRVLCVRDR